MRTCEPETEAANVKCLGRNIRNPQVQVPPSLKATCQLCRVSWKVGRNTAAATGPVGEYRLRMGKVHSDLL
jgi:hypothetical protein